MPTSDPHLISYRDQNIVKILGLLPLSAGTSLEWSGPAVLNGTSVLATTTRARQQDLAQRKREPARLVQAVPCGQDTGQTAGSCQPLGNSTLIVESELAPPSDVFITTYKCTVQPGGQTVALKLYLAQKARAPDLTELSRSEQDRLVFASMQSCPIANCFFSGEAQQYKTMAALQGDVLPYSYGFYLFALPGSEIQVVGHVMEYIDGQTVEQYLGGLNAGVSRDKERIRGLYLSAIIGVVKMHALNVSHRDIASRNMRIIPSTVNDGSLEARLPAVVYFDFGNAMQIDFLLEKGLLYWDERDFNGICALFDEAGVLDAIPFNDWVILQLATYQVPAKLFKGGYTLTDDGRCNLLEMEHVRKALEEEPVFSQS